MILGVFWHLRWALLISLYLWLGIGYLIRWAWS